MLRLQVSWSEEEDESLVFFTPLSEDSVTTQCIPSFTSVYLTLVIELDPSPDLHDRPTVISWNASSRNCITLIESWISHYDGRHSQCRSPSTTPLLRRVTDVDVYGTESTLRLYETQGVHASCTALGHCWETEQNYTMKTATLLDTCPGLGWDLLPKTSHDLIYTACKLHIRYVWMGYVVHGDLQPCTATRSCWYALH